MIDRTLKGIDLIEASPVYEALPGFQRLVKHPLYLLRSRGADDDPKDQRVILGAARIRHVEGSLLGHLLNSTAAPWKACLRTYLTCYRVNIIDASVGHTITSLPAQNVYELGFSPLGTFVITWQRPSKNDDGDAVKNLKVWMVQEGVPNREETDQLVVGRFVQKSQTGWNLQYTYDEQYCARVVSNEVQIFQTGDLTTVWKKLRVEGVMDFAASPGKNHSIAVFIPERKVSKMLAMLR